MPGQKKKRGVEGGPQPPPRGGVGGAEPPPFANGSNTSRKVGIIIYSY